MEVGLRMLRALEQEWPARAWAWLVLEFPGQKAGQQIPGARFFDSLQARTRLAPERLPRVSFSCGRGWQHRLGCQATRDEMHRLCNLAVGGGLEVRGIEPRAASGVEPCAAPSHPH